MTADHVSELEKTRLLHKKANIRIRMMSEDAKELSKFDAKFGATLEEAFDILVYSKKHNMEVVGASFHVGYNSLPFCLCRCPWRLCTSLRQGNRHGLPNERTQHRRGFPRAGCRFQPLI